jgi:hypothetical protein
MLRVWKKAFPMSGTPLHPVPCPECTEALQTIHIKSNNLSYCLTYKADILHMLANIQWLYHELCSLIYFIYLFIFTSFNYRCYHFFDNTFSSPTDILEEIRNCVLRRKCGSKIEEPIGEWSKVHKEELEQSVLFKFLELGPLACSNSELILKS